MLNLNRKLIITGMALLLFGILIAIMSQSRLSYIVGGLGLFFTMVGCFVSDNQGN